MPTGLTQSGFSRQTVCSWVPPDVGALRLPARDLQSRPDLAGAPNNGVEELELPDFFKDQPVLAAAPLAPAVSLSRDPQWTPAHSALARVYNRTGGLMTLLADNLQVDVAAALAVWYVESGGRVHTTGRAAIRFECNLFYSAWGCRNIDVYRRHFRHGGFDDHPGKPWENHMFRNSEQQPFRSVHTSQQREYEALGLAASFANSIPAALEATSIGGCQILIAHWRLIGYASAEEMYQAYQQDERAHVFGFFEFCRRSANGEPLKRLQSRDWQGFAYYYNGPGNVQTYATRIGSSYQVARMLLEPV